MLNGKAVAVGSQLGVYLGRGGAHNLLQQQQARVADLPPLRNILRLHAKNSATLLQPRPERIIIIIIITRLFNP